LKILVTGSSGQVGTNLCLALMEKGVDTLGIDRRENSWTDKIPLVLRDLAAEGMPSLEELAAAKEGFDSPDLVVHLAANAKVHELVVEPRRAHENATSSFNVLEFCRINQLPIILSSSREVYGQTGPPSVSEGGINAYEIRSPYAAYKLADEMLIYSYAHCYGLKYLIFRLSNVYGRYDSDLERMTRVIHIFIDQMSQDEPITIFDPTKMIDFTYIDDCVSGIMVGIEKLLSGEVVNETFNLSSAGPVTLAYLAEAIAENLDTTPEVINAPMRPGEISFYIADLTKARTLLGYEPQVPFDEGIKRAVEWVQAWNAQHQHS